MRDGHHTLSPPAGQLKVFTTHAGRMGRAGHDLELEVVRWRVRLFVVDGHPRDVSVTADPRSLRVLSATGGRRELSDDDKADIQQRIHEDVLEGRRIEFRSTHIENECEEIRIEGELELGTERKPLSFSAQVVPPNRIRGSVTIRQTDFGMKPYSAMLGALKVADEVRIELDTTVPV